MMRGRAVVGTAALIALAGALSGTLAGCAAPGQPLAVPPQPPPGFQDFGPPWHPMMPFPATPDDAIAAADPRFDGADTDLGAIPAPPAVPDIHLEQIVIFSDGSPHTCAVELSALPDGRTPGATTAAAKVSLALASTDWSTVLSVSSPLPGFPLQEQPENAGIPERDLRATEVATRVLDALSRMGLPDGYLMYVNEWCD